MTKVIIFADWLRLILAIMDLEMKKMVAVGLVKCKVPPSNLHLTNFEQFISYSTKPTSSQRRRK